MRSTTANDNNASTLTLTEQAVSSGAASDPKCTTHRDGARDAPSGSSTNAADATISGHPIPPRTHSKPQSGRQPRLALLMCDTPVGPVADRYGGSYLEIFRRFLEKTFPYGPLGQSEKDEAKDVKSKFTLDPFDVVAKQEYPDLSEGQYDGVILTGSSASAYDDKPWIKKLTTWVARLIEEYPKVKLIGICFGHQIVSRAMGGECISQGRWEVGTVDCVLTDVGMAVFQNENAIIRIPQMHRDHVPLVPPSFHLLAYSFITPVHGLIRYYRQLNASSEPPSDSSTLSQAPLTPNSFNPARDIHVLTLQGHPEYTADIVHDTINVREANGKMDADTVRDGRARADLPHDGDGFVGRAVWRMLGVEFARGH